MAAINIAAGCQYYVYLPGFPFTLIYELRIVMYASTILYEMLTKTAVFFKTGTNHGFNLQVGFLVDLYMEVYWLLRRISYNSLNYHGTWTRYNTKYVWPKNLMIYFIFLANFVIIIARCDKQTYIKIYIQTLLLKQRLYHQRLHQNRPHILQHTQHNTQNKKKRTDHV